MRSIGQKLFLGFIAMAVLTIGVLWLIQAGVMRDSYVRGRIDSVDQAIQQVVEDRGADRDYDALSEQLNASLVVIGKQGDVQYRSQGLPMMGMMLRAIQSMVPGQTTGEVQFVQSMAGAGRYAVLGHDMPDGRYLFAVFSLADVDEAAAILRRQLWIVTVILFVSASLLAVFLSRRLSQPIQAVTAAAHELARGNLAVALPVTSRDEVGRLTTALNELSRELQKTDQLRKELIANVSHELRAPLAVIKGYAETVRDVTWPQEDKRRSQLTLIADEADRLTAVVRDILDYSRLQAGVQKIQSKDIAIKPVLEQVLTRYEQQARLAGLSFALSADDVRIRFDEARLIQVLHNLVSNAINHGQPGTVITVSAAHQAMRCRISIRNTGATIPPEELGRIWERFHQAGSRPLGTGLGLAIVKSILEQHQANFGVQSENGITEFWFDAPAAEV
ncbi:MAG: HAMP domain-containing sensor histidine kinase [Candidatus Nanoarchaeia archaeon]|nr:HAMP domain-containing sensor histidine kinase [Candidatus Nanoarchaeia archaeon]